MDQVVKNLPAIQETWERLVQSWGWGDHMEMEMATHSSILAWEVPQTEEPGGLHPWGCKESDMTERLSTDAHLLNILFARQSAVLIRESLQVY